MPIDGYGDNYGSNYGLAIGNATTQANSTATADATGTSSATSTSRATAVATGSATGVSSATSAAQTTSTATPSATGATSVTSAVQAIATATADATGASSATSSVSVQAQATAFYTPFVRSTSREPVEAIVDILSQIGPQFWTLGDPERVESMWQNTHKFRQNEPDPSIYVWQPTETDVQQLSADGRDRPEFGTVEIHIWTLSEVETSRYYRDVADILDRYINDNEHTSQFVGIKTDTVSDDRNENIPRQTDHYIARVQVETHYHRDVGALTN